MLKRHGWSVVLKRHRSSVESLPHDVVELILERLPVKSLLRFRSVSKKWRWTIYSQRFWERQLIRRRQSRGPDVLFVSLYHSETSETDDDGDDDDDIDEAQIVYDDDADDDDADDQIVNDGADLEDEIVLGSSIVRKVKFPFSNLIICHGSCDGLVCLFCLFTPNIVVNPATQWHQSFPFSSVQQIIINKLQKREPYCSTYYKPGFGKDIVKGTYKPVWLFNSSELGLDNVTTCEVFDFSTNAWRYVVPASPYQILPLQRPVYLDGSLYWLTGCVDAKVLSFDLHTETFKVISKAPFTHVPDPNNVILCILDNRLCVSEKDWPTQDIWSLCSSGTWNKICSIDHTKTFPWFKRFSLVPLPVAILEKNKLLLHGRENKEPLVLHDLHTKSYDLLARPTTYGYCVHYFESLFSVLSN
ncbi:F-box domain [Arabidopsis suecica]|uniref:F-box domain n=1 Tax=Arabidopsis suecica TaxID=45249 RepID=A0A8T2AF83_ARASU|nr:F-box domain [Arabidopsis suecica]